MTEVRMPEGVLRPASAMEAQERPLHPTASGRTVVAVGPVAIGGAEIVLIAGPCAVEGGDILLETARAAGQAGARILRGGAFKPRTSPRSFQGLGEEGLRLLAEARQATGLPVVTEVLDPRDVDLVAAYADMLQIGSRNMQNFALLREVGRSGRPVLLKRGMSATIEEWLAAAEHVIAAGNPNVVLCERGIRTIETYTRNTLDLSAVAAAKRLSLLPVIVDPSHATGRPELIGPMSLAAVAAGADGLMIEVHPRPQEALSDGQQALRPEELRVVWASVAAVAEAVGRQVQLSATCDPRNS